MALRPSRDIGIVGWVFRNNENSQSLLFCRASKAHRMKGYALARDVEFDLNEIWESIADDSVSSADKWIAKLFDAFDLIARNPGIGHAREDLTAHSVCFGPLVRFWSYTEKRIDTVEIVAVVRGARHSGFRRKTQFVT